LERQGKEEIFEEKETHAILDLMRGMLNFSPEERLTIDEVFTLEWMVNWAMPQLGYGYTLV
jgi:hypothetical protein